MSNTDLEDFEDEHEDDNLNDGGEVETRARSMGWMPEEEFKAKGFKGQWRPAEEFVQRAEENPNILRERYDSLERKYADLERVNKETGTRVTEMSDLLRDSIANARKRENAAYERGLKDLKARADAAAIDGDSDTYRETRAQIDEMEAARPEPVPEPEKTDPAVEGKAIADAWISRNSWYNTDDELRDIVTGMDVRLAKTMPDLESRLNHIEAEVKRRYPAKFRNKKRDEPGTVSNSAPPSGRNGKGKKTYDDLPAEAKQECDRFVKLMGKDKDGKPFTREEYVAEYFAGEQS
jgi:hypothetical protein